MSLTLAAVSGVQSLAGFSLAWTETQQGLSLSGSVLQSTTNGPNLVLAAEDLYSLLLAGLSLAEVEAQAYRFRLTATRDSDGATGFAELALALNSPPFGGSFTATPTADTSGTAYTLTSSGWQDSSPSLSYRYLYSSSSAASGAAGREQAISQASSSPVSLAVLPPGVLTLSAVIADEVSRA